jgi:hypothetical protein
VVDSVSDWRSSELLHLHVGMPAKPEDKLCPMTMSFLPDTSLINELFPAPVTPITAMTMSDEIALILADDLAKTRRFGRLATFNELYDYASFDSRRSAL